MQRLWWLNLVRGIVALILSILIIGWSQAAQGFFVNFLAMYWLSSGLLSLRGGLSTHQQKGWWLINGLLSIIVGLGLLLRPVYKQYLTSELAIKGFGLIAFFVGLSHIFSAYQTLDRTHERVLGIFLLGLFEAGLGALLFFSNALEPWAKLVAGGWALIGGLLLIFQSLQIRRASLSGIERQRD